jgi:glutaredoxin
MKTLKQQCSLAAVWLTWLMVPVVAVAIGLRRGWVAGVLVLLVGEAAQLLALRWFRPWFPAISRWLGYGSVADVPAAGGAALGERQRITLYTANVCPFCPIVRQRLTALRTTLGFEVEEVDVTFRPDVVVRKGLRSVPVLEADGRYLVGNATTAELVAFLRPAPVPPVRVG